MDIYGIPYMCFDILELCWNVRMKTRHTQPEIRLVHSAGNNDQSQQLLSG